MGCQSPDGSRRSWRAAQPWQMTARPIGWRQHGQATTAGPGRSLQKTRRNARGRRQLRGGRAPEALTFDVADAPVVAAFWAALLDREVVMESDGAFLPGDHAQIGLRFVTSGTKQVDRPRLISICPAAASRISGERSRRRSAWAGAPLTWAKRPTTPTSCWPTLAAMSCVLSSRATTTLLAPAISARSPVTEPGTSACSGATRWAGRWCGTRTSRPQFSRRSGAPKSHGTHGADRRYPRTERIGSASTWSPPTPGEAGTTVSLGASRLAQLSDQIKLADPDGNEFGLARSLSVEAVKSSQHAGDRSRSPRRARRSPCGTMMIKAVGSDIQADDLFGVRPAKQRGQLGGGPGPIPDPSPDRTDIGFRSGTMTLDTGPDLWDGRSGTNADCWAHWAARPLPRLRSFGWFLQLPVWRRGSEPRS